MAELSACKILLIVLIAIVLYLIYTTHKKEGFTGLTQNEVYNNAFENADMMDYTGTDKIDPVFQQTPNTYNASDNHGVNMNSQSDVFDSRGYKWTANSKNANIDAVMNAIDDATLKTKFERMYMLDPTGYLDQFDVTKMEVSPLCCSAQYKPPFVTDNKELDAKTCEYAQKYIANNYMGLSTYGEGYGCPCMTPSAGAYITSRASNSYNV